MIAALLVGACLTSVAEARDIYLQPGESIRIGSNAVSCGGNPSQETKWQCACFGVGGRNYGMVWGIWADDQRDAEYSALRQCNIEYRHKGRTTSTSCSAQMF